MKEGSGGASVIGLAFAGLTLLVLAILLVNGLASLQDAEAQRIDASARLEDAWGRAQAGIIQAQGQARLDSAQAFAVTAGAAYPWLVTGLLGVAGLVLIAAVVAMLVLALRVTQVSRQDKMLLMLMAQQRMLLPGEQPILARLPAYDHNRVIEL